MRFFKANFHRYVVKKPRNASALLTFLPCLGKNLLLKNCFTPDGFFGAVWFFFGEAILSYCETKRAAMCRKTNSSGALGSALLSLAINCAFKCRKIAFHERDIALMVIKVFGGDDVTGIERQNICTGTFRN